MPAFFDLEYYFTRKPGPGTGPGRMLAMFFLMCIRDHATRWMLGPAPQTHGAFCCHLSAVGKFNLVPPPLWVASCIARFVQQLVGGNGSLTLQLHGQQLAVQVSIEPRDLTPQITVELPIAKTLQTPAVDLLKKGSPDADMLVEFEDAEFENEPTRPGQRTQFQLDSKIDRSGIGSLLLGRSRMPFHPEMHPPTKFLLVVLLTCFRDGAKELEFVPAGHDLWTRYLIEYKWHDLRPAPGFVWPQLVRVIERHAILIRPESCQLDTPAIGWLELRWGQDLPPDHLAVFVDPREATANIRIKFMRVNSTKTDEQGKPPRDEDEDDDGSFAVHFSPDDQ